MSIGTESEPTPFLETDALASPGLLVTPGESVDPTIMTHRSLEAINNVALRLARLLMESGAHSSVVRANTVAIATAMGAHRAELRVGYASLTLTLGYAHNTMTRMVAIGEMGVNQRQERALRDLIARVVEGDRTVSPSDLDREIDTLVRESPRYPIWFTCLAVGFACAAFVILLGGDVLSALVVMPVSTVAQFARSRLKKRAFNPYLTIVLLAFSGSLVSGWLSALIGTDTAAIAMIGPTLMLVPGVVAINGLSDVLEGRPTLGAARMIVVATVMLFLALGVWNATVVLERGGLLSETSTRTETGG